MSRQTENEDDIRRYLLGELSDDEQEQIESRLLADDDFYQQVLVAEDELTYEFVCDELTEQEKKSFHRHVLPVPERREDIKFARVLRKYVRENTPRVIKTATARKERTSWLEPFAALFRRPIVGFTLATLLLLAIALAAWTVIQNRRLRDQIAQSEAQQRLPPAPAPDLQEQLAAERQRTAELADELRHEQELRASAEQNLAAAEQQAQKAAVSGTPPQTSAATIVSFLLIPGVSRDSGDGEVKKISVPRGAREIRLQLDLAASNYGRYRAALKTVEGQKELLVKGMLRARAGAGGTTVSLNVPAKFLHRGDYQIELSGQTSTAQYEEIDTYYFRVAE